MVAASKFVTLDLLTSLWQTAGHIAIQPSWRVTEQLAYAPLTSSSISSWLVRRSFRRCVARSPSMIFNAAVVAAATVVGRLRRAIMDDHRRSAKPAERTIPLPTHTGDRQR